MLTFRDELAGRAFKVATSSTAVRVQPDAKQTLRVETGCYITTLAANSAPVFVGGSDVTTGEGFELKAGVVQFFSVDPRNLYVISAAAQEIRVLLT